MEEKIVKTVKGVEAYEKNCRLIDGVYYLIGDNKVEDSGDIYLINNRYIKATTKMIVFDHFEEEYKYRNSSLVEGIINVDGEEITYGYFTPNNVYNVRVVLKDKSDRVAISSNVLGYGFREKRSDGIFYHISLIDAKRFNELRGVSRDLKESLPYDSKGVIDKVSKTYESNYNPVICEEAKRIGTALKGYTFGIEFETVAGIVSNSKLNCLPLIPLRDGSIDGLEYATVPLQGGKGVQAIIDCADELERRTEFDQSCSLHLHIGGMPRTVEFILAFYKFTSMFQNEIFSMFPLYKKYNFGVKRKNYSAPFPFEEINFRMDPYIKTTDKASILRNFDHLFMYLSGGHSFAEFDHKLENIQFHPQDPAGNQKWNIKHRYSYINFIPLLFCNKKTIEFRIHTPTYDANKIVDFLMLNTFMIDYVNCNTKRILEGSDPCMRARSLNYFIDEYCSKYVGHGSRAIHEELSNYLYERKQSSERLTRDQGVSYPESAIRMTSYMRFKPYEFIRSSDKKRMLEQLYGIQYDSKSSFDSIINSLNHELEMQRVKVDSMISAKQAVKASEAAKKNALRARGKSSGSIFFRETSVSSSDNIAIGKNIPSENFGWFSIDPIAPGTPMEDSKPVEKTRDDESNVF